MITNTEITVYHKVLNQTTRLEEWVKYYYDHCWWFDSNGTVTNKGYENANLVDIRIPYDINPSLDVSDFSIGDIVCRGIVEANAETVLTQEHYNITMINNNTFGTQQHIHIGGK